MLKKLFISLSVLAVLIGSNAFAWVGDGTTLADKDTVGSPIWARLTVMRGQPAGHCNTPKTDSFCFPAPATQSDYDYAKSIEASEPSYIIHLATVASNYYIASHPEEFSGFAVELAGGSNTQQKEYNNHPLRRAFTNGLTDNSIGY